MSSDVSPEARAAAFESLRREIQAQIPSTSAERAALETRLIAELGTMLPTEQFRSVRQALANPEVEGIVTRIPGNEAATRILYLIYAIKDAEDADKVLARMRSLSTTTAIDLRVVVVERPHLGKRGQLAARLMRTQRGQNVLVVGANDLTPAILADGLRAFDHSRLTQGRIPANDVVINLARRARPRPMSDDDRAWAARVMQAIHAAPITDHPGIGSGRAATFTLPPVAPPSTPPGRSGAPPRRR